MSKELKKAQVDVIVRELQRLKDISECQSIDIEKARKSLEERP